MDNHIFEAIQPLSLKEFPFMTSVDDLWYITIVKKKTFDNLIPKKLPSSEEYWTNFTL